MIQWGDLCMVITHPNKGVVVVVTEEKVRHILGIPTTLFSYEVVGYSSMRGVIEGKEVSWRSTYDLKDKTGFSGMLSTGDLLLLCHPL